MRIIKHLRIDLTLYTILRAFSAILFEKILISQALTPDFNKPKITSEYIQLKLFNS